jgi:hypothetical protein
MTKDLIGDMTQFTHINQKYALEMRLESGPTCAAGSVSRFPLCSHGG